MSEIYIYALTDPDSAEVRYIGKTIRPKERLQNHCNDKTSCHRVHWIQSLIAAGKRPALIILECLSADADWQAAEKRWIADARTKGWRLTNSTDGGDGVVNLSGESKARMLQTWKGRKHRPESLLKIGAASRGRRHTEEYKQMMREKMSVRDFTPDHRERLSKANRKLTDAQALEILAALAGGERQKVLADRYGVDKGTISNIKRGVSYSHLQLPT